MPPGTLRNNKDRTDNKTKYFKCPEPGIFSFDEIFNVWNNKFSYYEKIYKQNIINDYCETVILTCKEIEFLIAHQKFAKIL